MYEYFWQLPLLTISTCTERGEAGRIEEKGEGEFSLI